MTARSAPMAAIALVVAAGCAPSPAPADAAGGDAVSADVATTDALADATPGDAPAGTGCEAPPDARAPGATCVRRVTGRLVDEAGAPLGARPVTVCGAVCFVARARDDGAFDVPVDDFLEVAGYSVQGHGRPEHASAYVPMPPPRDGVASLAEPIALPRYVDSGSVVPDGAAGGEVTAGDVTLVVPREPGIEFDLEDFELGELGRRLRVAAVDVARAPAFAAEGRVAGVVWALAPFNLRAARPIGVRVRNRAGLAPGAAVEFVAMGNESVIAPTNAGHAVVVARGRVSADGATVSTDPGEGVRYLTWLGVRAGGATR